MSPFINLFARQPSPSVEPDYDNPGNRPTVAITLIAIANAFLLFFVVSRVYSRLEKGLFSWGEGNSLLICLPQGMVGRWPCIATCVLATVMIIVIDWSSLSTLAHMDWSTGRFNSFLRRDNWRWVWRNSITLVMTDLTSNSLLQSGQEASMGHSCNKCHQWRQTASSK